MERKYKFLLLLLTAALVSVTSSFYCNHKKWKVKISHSNPQINDKRHGKCHRLRPRALAIMKYFAPQEVVGKSMARVGRDYDGGYVMVNDFQCCEAAYSFGISDDVSWDLDMAKKNINVFMFDHTISGLPIQNPLFHFFKTGICGNSEKMPNLKTFEEILSDNGHLENKNLVLKIDVEGAEWDSFASTPSEIFDNFMQIVVEFHGVNEVYNDQKFNKMLDVFEKLKQSHEVVHVHANNYGNFDIIGGVPLPATYEITYLRRRDNKFIKSERIYPVQGLDMPNNPDAADFFLGCYGVML